MSIYHLQTKVLGRSHGRSVVAAAAYISCSQMTNAFDGVEHSYKRKRGCVHQEVMIPGYANPEWYNRENLWNAVEFVEKAKDSRLAREFIVALPKELAIEEWIRLLRKYIQKNFVELGMCVDYAIHDNGDGNPHAHILCTVRPLYGDGTWQPKTQKEYLCVRNREERGFTASEFALAKKEGWQKQYSYMVNGKKYTCQNRKH